MERVIVFQLYMVIYRVGYEKSFCFSLVVYIDGLTVAYISCHLQILLQPLMTVAQTNGFQFTQSHLLFV